MIRFEKLEIEERKLRNLSREYGYTIANFNSALKRALDRTAKRIRKETARKLVPRLGGPGPNIISRRLKLYSLLSGRRKRIWLGHKYGITATRFSNIRKGLVYSPYPRPTYFPNSFYGSIKNSPVLPWQRIGRSKVAVIRIPFNKDAQEVMKEGHSDVRPYFFKEFQSALKGIFVRQQRSRGVIS